MCRQADGMLQNFKISPLNYRRYWLLFLFWFFFVISTISTFNCFNLNFYCHSPTLPNSSWSDKVIGLSLPQQVFLSFCQCCSGQNYSPISLSNQVWQFMHSFSQCWYIVGKDTPKDCGDYVNKEWVTITSAQSRKSWTWWRSVIVMVSAFIYQEYLNLLLYLQWVKLAYPQIHFSGEIAVQIWKFFLTYFSKISLLTKYKGKIS